MNRRQFLKTASVAAAPLAAQQSSVRPNIVFILADDHRWDFLSARGHPWLKTPHLDRLFQEGVAFDNAFVTTSLCSPSRASILTGQYLHGHGVKDNFSPLKDSLPTFPRELQKAGYRTAFLGKWHMGGDSDEPRPGFDHWVSFFGQGEYFDPPLNVNGKQLKASGYITDILTTHAVKFLEDSRGKPFCLYLSHKAVHSPFQPAPRHKTLYENAPVPRPDTLLYNQTYYDQLPEWVFRRRFARHGAEGLLGHLDSFDNLYRDYARSLMAIDDSTGEVLGALDRLNLTRNTLVIYMGDNGYMWGEHGLIDKRSMHEPSIRVPLMARCPALFEGGRKVQEMALNIDMAPTILEAAGVKAPDTIHGRSLLPILRGRAADWRDAFLYEYEWERDYPQTPTILGIRTKKYSFATYYGIWDKEELYDLESDPLQKKNLLGQVRILRRGRLLHQIDDPELKKLVDSLQRRMAKLLEESGGDPALAGVMTEGNTKAW